MERHILCIDLKSFFASVECIDLGLDPFTTPLVVANTKQGNGAITLAVTPYLKKKGIKGRTRLYDIPKEIFYKKVNPRMGRYIEMSKKVVQIYLDFVSEEDLHIYSIDECFLDVTDYLSYYKMNEEQLAEKILNTVEEKTRLTATCGIGPNLFLAKVAMDTEAKLYKNGIAKWTMEDVETKLWKISPLSRIWGIGPRMERKLNLLGIFSIGDLAHFDRYLLKEKFGVIGDELWCHAHGLDDSLIHDFRYEAKEKSLSHSQVLMRDYFGEEILLIVREMLEVLAIRLRKEHLETSSLGFGLQYSKLVGGGFFHSVRLSCATDLEKEIYPLCQTIFETFYDGISPIRKVSLSFGKLSKKEGIQLNLFDAPEDLTREEQLSFTLDSVKNKFGKNSILHASSLLSYSTVKERNQKIGGHHV